MAGRSGIFMHPQIASCTLHHHQIVNNEAVLWLRASTKTIASNLTIMLRRLPVTIISAYATSKAELRLRCQGATVPDSSKGVTTPPPLKPPSLNPFDMFKGRSCDCSRTCFGRVRVITASAREILLAQALCHSYSLRLTHH